MLPVVFANGNIGRPLFVIQGTHVKFRVQLRNGNEVIETLADCLPRGSVIAAREDVASVDSHNVLQWAKLFVEDVKDLTADGRRVLQILDGYRGNMNYTILKLIESSGVIVYAVPVHTSSST